MFFESNLLHTLTHHHIALHTLTHHYIVLHTLTHHYIVLHTLTHHYIVLHTLTHHYIALSILEDIQLTPLVEQVKNLIPIYLKAGDVQSNTTMLMF